MKKLFLFLGIMASALIAKADPGDVTAINTISPKNGAFQFIVRSTNVFVSTATFGNKLSTNAYNLQGALEEINAFNFSGGAASNPLAVKLNGVAVSSPTTVINFVSPMIATLTGGSTAQVTIDTSTANGVLLISSATNNFLTQSSATATYFNILSSTTLLTTSSATANYLTLSSAAATYVNNLTPYVSSVTAGTNITITGSSSAPIINASASGSVSLSTMTPGATNYIFNQNFNQVGSTASPNFLYVAGTATVTGAIAADSVTNLGANANASLGRTSLSLVASGAAATIRNNTISSSSDLDLQSGRGNGSRVLVTAGAGGSSVLVASFTANNIYLSTAVQFSQLGSGVMHTTNGNVSLKPVDLSTETTGVVPNASIDGSSITKQGLLVAGSNITLTPGAGTLTIAATSGGGGSALAITTGTASGYSAPPTASAATGLVFDQAAFNTQLIGGTSVFVTINNGSSNGTIFAMTASSSVTNSAVETNVVGVGSGTVTLPANYLQVAKTLRVKASGIYTSTTTAGTITFKFKLGTTVIVSTASINLPATQTNQLWSFGLALTVRSSGASGTVFGNTAFGLNDATNGWKTCPMTMTTPVTVDMTAAQDISITAQFSVANASNTFTTTNFVVVGETVTTVGGVAGGGSGGGGYAVQPATVTFQLNQGATVSTLTATGAVTFSSTTVGLFEAKFWAAQAKLPSSNSPYISNSTGETSAGIYFDDTSTQTVTWSDLTTRYDGRPLYAAIIFTSTATSGTINFGVSVATQTPNVTPTNFDTLTYNTEVTLSVTTSANSNALQLATIPLSTQGLVNGQLYTVQLRRLAGLLDTAVGFARVRSVVLYE